MGLKLIELRREQGETDAKKIEDEFDALLTDAEAEATMNNEIEFVSDMRANFDVYGVNIFCSEKQLSWLQRIAGNDSRFRQ